jgi:Flp pilus assembly protein TadD
MNHLSASAFASSGESPAGGAPSRLHRLLGYLAQDPGNERLRADAFDEALASGAFDAARQLADEALGRAPGDAAWRHRGALLDMAGQAWTRACAGFEALRREGHGGPALAYNLAYIDFAQGHIAQAEEALRPLVAEALEQVPQSLALLVSCQHRRGAPDEAVATFRAHAARASTAAALGAASLAALDAEELVAAAAWADQALAQDDRQQEALVAKATLRVAARDAAGALQLLVRALERAPNDGRVLSTMAMAEMLAGRLPQAKALYTRAVALMTDHIGTWIGLGWCEVFLHDLAGARAAVEAALAIDPRFGESHGLLAVVEALEGRAEAAGESIRRAQALDRAGLSVEYARAILAGEAQDPQRLLKRAELALARHAGPGGRTLADVVLGRGTATRTDGGP